MIVMRFARRKFLRLAAGAAALPAFSGAVTAQTDRAQTSPSRPLHFIVGFSPGGGSDTVSRIMAQGLSDRLGEAIVVENKPGASTNLSIQAVTAAAPDGYTL